MRPKVNLALQQAIAGAEAIPLEETRASTAAAHQLTQTDPQKTVAGNASAQQPVSVGPTLPTALPEKKPRSKWIAVAALIALALVAAIAVFVLRAPKTPKSGAALVYTETQSPPPVYSDDHGRMLLVGAGPFHFSEAGSSGAQTMELPGFYVDETEVTNAEYRRFCEATRHAPPQNPDYSTHPDYPVSGVSYEDALAYASWAGRRLPTEAEWEKAARGTDERTYPWGDAAWTSEVPSHLQAVTSEPERRSPYGAYNMAGNVWEWTRTPYTPQPSDIAGMKRLVGGEKFSSNWQVIKGGSFSPGGSENFAISKRRGLPTDARSPWIGFRCVRDLTPASR